MSTEPNDLDAKLRTFIRNTREIFSGESWDQVQNYVEQVWLDSGYSELADWADIQARLRSEWDAEATYQMWDASAPFQVRPIERRRR